MKKEEIDRLIETYTNNKSPVFQEALPPQIQKYATHIVKECARHHLDIIDLCMQVEDEFSVLILLQFLASLTMLCFNLFQLYIVSKSIYYFVWSVTHAFIFSPMFKAIVLGV